MKFDELVEMVKKMPPPDPDTRYEITILDVKKVGKDGKLIQHFEGAKYKNRTYMDLLGIEAACHGTMENLLDLGFALAEDSPGKK